MRMRVCLGEGRYPRVYTGSVKTVLAVAPPKGARSGLYVFSFTDDYSVFDYGKMPDRIRGKGSALAVVTAYLFEQMEDPASWRKVARSRVWERLGGRETRELFGKGRLGSLLGREGLRTHYKGIVDAEGRVVTTRELDRPSRLLLVEAVPVLRPERGVLAGSEVWNYNGFHAKAGPYLVPLENVVRFGVPKGSSLIERVTADPSYGRQLGLEGPPEPGSWLSSPLLEFFTKLEPSDRHLSLESALNFSGLSNREFSELMQRSLLAALFLYALLYEKGLELWDGKFEFFKAGKGLVLADSITPDEVRLTFQGKQLSKELLRQYYKHYDGEFCRAISEAKKLPMGALGSLKDILNERFDVRPRRLDPEFRVAVEELYRSLAKRITGLDIFGPTRDLEELVGVLDKWGVTD